MAFYNENVCYERTNLSFFCCIFLFLFSYTLFRFNAQASLRIFYENMGGIIYDAEEKKSEFFRTAFIAQ